MIQPEIFLKTLLDQWCNEEDHYGLTIPLVIGSIRQNTPETGYSISDLFRQIIETDHKVRIRNCNDLGEVILGLFKSTDGPHHYYENLGSIYYSEEELGVNFQTLENIVEYFQTDYADKIQRGLFSKDYYKGEWTSVNEEDKQLIDKVKRRILDQNLSNLTTT